MDIGGALTGKPSKKCIMSSWIKAKRLSRLLKHDNSSLVGSEPWTRRKATSVKLQFLARSSMEYPR